MKQFDLDRSGHIDDKEFLMLATILCHNVAGRVSLEIAFAFVVRICRCPAAHMLTCPAGPAGPVHAVSNHPGAATQSWPTAAPLCGQVGPIFAAILVTAADKFMPPILTPYLPAFTHKALISVRATIIVACRSQSQGRSRRNESEVAAHRALPCACTRCDLIAYSLAKPLASRPLSLQCWCRGFSRRLTRSSTTRAT